ncbi:Jag N-terminal domain-containing protein [Acidimicrobiales bacterium]|nr:Jag N-terminal domain-containing protein [Acidimicrobiales bacterium]
MEWVVTAGKTVEEAKDVALDRLGVHGDDAEFEVLSEVKTGLFGRVKEDARVRARVRPSTPRSKDERRGRGRNNKGSDRNRPAKGDGVQGQGQGRGQGRGKGQGQGQRGQDQGRGEAQSSEKKSRRDEGANKRQDGNGRPAKQSNENKVKEKPMSDEPMMPLPQQADIAEEFMSGLAERFGVTVEMVREDVADDEIRITVSGDDMGRMIGRRGATAMAIDDLVRTVLQRQAGSSRDGRIRVDVGGVRTRRAEALANFCRAQAVEVRESGVARSLEPMGGADRKVVHDTIAEEDGVDTVSEGEDPNRRVVIVPAEDAA